MGKHRQAEVFPPGDFIREELAERQWTAAEFAEILGRPATLVNRLLAGKRPLSAELAKEIGLAFGTGPELWLNLETAYRLATTDEPDPKFARRATAAT
jgi:HTH-type transcriptional regulator/antitoxin HigA